MYLENTCIVLTVKSVASAENIAGRRTDNHGRLQRNPRSVQLGCSWLKPIWVLFYGGVLRPSVRYRGTEGTGNGSPKAGSYDTVAYIACSQRPDTVDGLKK
jgi:hypothetical protein